jgi:hypothetical protein
MKKFCRNFMILSEMENIHGILYEFSSQKVVVCVVGLPKTEQPFENSSTKHSESLLYSRLVITHIQFSQDFYNIIV